MLVNVLTNEPTHFYMQSQNHVYGVRVNIKEAKNKDNIIKQLLEENKQTINDFLKIWR